MEACPDFDKILARFWSDFGNIFGQVFDEGFGQVFWSTKYRENTVVQGQKKKERKT